jgi:hypothetical protein
MKETIGHVILQDLGSAGTCKNACHMYYSECILRPKLSRIGIRSRGTTGDPVMGPAAP